MIAWPWAAAIRRPPKFPEEIFPHAQKCCQDRHRWAGGQLAGGELLVPHRRPADVAALWRADSPRGTAGPARARSDRDPVILLLARLNRQAGTERRGRCERVAV